jgi:hypothetical protein
MSISILVCGSRNFNDRLFVYGFLDQLQEQIGVHTVVTSRFAGACQLATEWVNDINESLPKEKRIKIKECSFDELLAKKNSDFYDQKHYHLDDEMLALDEFFIDGSKKLSQLQVNALVPFPNPQCEIGPHTSNIIRFAKLANKREKTDIAVIEATPEAYKLVLANREQEATKALEQNDQALQPEGLKNAHPARKLK